MAVDVEPGAEEAMEEEEGPGPPVGEVLPALGPGGGAWVRRTSTPWPKRSLRGKGFKARRRSSPSESWPSPSR